jgi:hypothetical protein
MEVGLETCSIHSTHLTDGGSIVLGQSAVARCPEPTASQVNNAGSKKIYEVFFSEPAVTSSSVVLYSLTSFRGTRFCLNRRKVLGD